MVQGFQTNPKIKSIGSVKQIIQMCFACLAKRAANKFSKVERKVGKPKMIFLQQRIAALEVLARTQCEALHLFVNRPDPFTPAQHLPVD